MPENTPAIPSKPPVVDPDVLIVREFLAGREAPCPVCNYNLRGLGTSQCPECGESLKLHLQPTSPLAGRRSLLLLVFLWLIAVGAAHSYLIGRSIQETASNPFAQFFTLTSTGGISIPNQATGQDGGPVINLGPTPQSGSGTSIPPSISWQGLLSPGQPQGYNWTLISWQQWTHAGVWGMLLIVGLIGVLLLLLARKRKEPSFRLSRTISVLAWSGFGVYCGFHLLTTGLRLL